MVVISIGLWNSFSGKKCTNLKNVFFFVAKMHMRLHVIEPKIQHWNERAQTMESTMPATAMVIFAENHTNDAKYLVAAGCLMSRICAVCTVVFSSSLSFFLLYFISSLSTNLQLMHIFIVRYDNKIEACVKL